MIRETPLLLCAEYGTLDLLNILLKNGAELDVTNKFGYSPLGLALLQNRIQLARRLLKAGLPNPPDCGQALHGWAMSAHKDDQMEPIGPRLMDGGCDVNAANDRGSTPLHLAAFGKGTETVRVLIDWGANVNARNDSGKTPLSRATRKKTIELLLDAGAKPGRQKYPDRKITPLIEYADEGYPNIVDRLLSSGAAVNASDEYGNTALIEAAHGNNKQVVERLLRADARVDLKNDNGRTALMEAAENGHPAIVGILLEAGADPSARDGAGLTPMMIAASEGRVDVMNILLSQGIDLNAEDKDGMTALMHASVQGQSEAVSWFIDQGVRLNVRDEHGRTALYHAIHYFALLGSLDGSNNSSYQTVVNKLIESGSDLSITPKDDSPPLSIVCRELNDDEIKTQMHSLLKLLIEKGASPNIRGDSGQTPLMHAAKSGSVKGIQRLLEARSKHPSLRSKGKQTHSRRSW